MKKSYYLVENIKYYYYDEEEQEDVEDRWFVGIFSTFEKSIKVKKMLETSEYVDDIRITKYDVNCGNNQKYIYILIYEYSLLIDDIYHDYYYNFDPKSSEKECIELRNSLFKLDKYKIDSKKIYDEETYFGFGIMKFEIDMLLYDRFNEKI